MYLPCSAKGAKGRAPFMHKRGGAYKACVTAAPHSCTWRGRGKKGPWEGPCPLWFCVSCNWGLGGKKGGRRGEARARW
jgi:hypothetical protein